MDAESALAYIADILEAIANIEEDIAGLDHEVFKKDRRARQLVERNIEIISEASRRVPDDLKAGEHSVPWPQVRSIGNILRHEYRTVVADVLWDAATVEVPPLKRAMLRMREKLADAPAIAQPQPKEPKEPKEGRLE